MPLGLDNDITRQQAESAIGGAVRVQDLSGVGEKTRKNLRSEGFRSTQDIKDASPSELQSVPGVGEKTARNMIRESGGNPRNNRRQSSGSVSAAGIRSPIGDFKVGLGEKDKAQARFDDSINRGIGRTKQAAQSDKGKRAPITTDFDEWQANKGALDYPGVDTPTDDPKVMEQDRVFISPDDLISDAKEDFF